MRVNGPIKTNTGIVKHKFLQVKIKVILNTSSVKENNRSKLSKEYIKHRSFISIMIKVRILLRIITVNRTCK